AVDNCQDGTATKAGKCSQQRAVSIGTAEGGGERAAEHVALERQSDESRALGEDTAGSGEQVGNSNAQRLREEEERRHHSRLRRARSRRRTSGTDTATAMITTACRTSPNCFGTIALPARPPAEHGAHR